MADHHGGVARLAPRATSSTPDSSLSGMIATLVPVLLLAAVYIVIFLFFRKKYNRNYAPRTYLGNVPV